ncbi:limonene-1,2-epoxide hydrolase [Gordonia desulfuricans]|uniref:Limonene-1,2-epoxide hydrolase n=1 Tax=Gordonia desulfuricans TaxID=89051 RepID=A0A7K3LLZ7_9ACTN|nr:MULTISPECIES: limonene-1,2-epoxide hydrolase family protein [Gordonia]KOY49096.1 limonene-1,2-epoxide hydrolase [Gordonia sp. NB41Y]NDK89275.1 limonene-1,2-epoxide hydrolase [Gordonia desulfuricans]WLP91787.1 limonene-1,2-epoxide hydrolase family protein [Gordonia sp. NB41Y]
MTSRTPIEIVTGFLDSLARGDVDAAMLDVADNIDYTNVSLPTVRGKRKVAKIFAAMKPARLRFNLEMVNIAEDGTVVLTERIDEISLGRLHLQFWVCGRFEVRNAQIVVWRDYFDYLDMTKALLRGLAALAVPSLVTPLPAPGAVSTNRP